MTAKRHKPSLRDQYCGTMKRFHTVEIVMASRLTDRFEPYPRLDEKSCEPSAALLDLLYRLEVEGSVFHVIEHIPEQTEDVFTVLCDDQIVLSFEVPRNTSPLIAEGLKRKPVAQYRLEIGQGKKRIRLDRTLENVWTLLGK